MKDKSFNLDKTLKISGGIFSFLLTAVTMSQAIKERNRLQNELKNK